MIATRQDPVERYLKRLDAELRDLPRARRREIVDEISEHIAEAGAQSEVEVLTLLDRLGDPADIAADARERFGVSTRRRSGSWEVWTLILLLIGGAVVPFFGWLVGVALLWSSNAWSTSDKAIGTLVVPGGLAAGLYIGLGGAVTYTCAEGTPCDGPSALAVIGVIALLVAPVVTTFYLALRLRRARA
jgi:hypothetical protein